MFKLAIACLLPLLANAQTSPPDAVTEWIRGSAIPLATPVAGHGFEDMQPLRKVVGDARIVALGEATHGSREFFQMKHRMLEFLATQMGFTLFSIEANMPEAYKLNDFVLNGNGDPKALIKGMYFWTWDTQEVLDQVLWMREFNKSGKGPVQFTGFDMQTPKVALEIVREAVAKSDPEYAPTMATASKLALAPVRQQQPGFGTALGTFPLAAALGKMVRFSGYIKTEKVSGYAGLWWRADAGQKSISFKNMQGDGPKGTTDWTHYQIELPVPAETTNINFGVLMAGDGTAWFDDLKVELDGVTYRDPAFEFDFEGKALKGLYMPAPMYPARLDREVYHSGEQSLRISHAPVPVNPDAVDPKDAAAVWTKVVEHLEAAPKRDEWIIQNARVVLQCMQMRANQVSRDASMATNVKWILDQSPKAKIVLWAHNGHVMTSPRTMGGDLRRMFGDQMVVFGFSFHQGGFQAVSSGGKGLHDFTVPPAPNATLDTKLASARIPLFALDLRAAPKTGPVADWLHKSQGTRSIGAMYPEDSPYEYIAHQVAPETFDTILFVESVTPARPNSPRAAPMVTFPFQAGAPDASGGGEYRDPDFAVSVKLAKGWNITQAFRWGDHETTAPIVAADGSEAGRLYFRMHPNDAKTEAEARKLLLASPESKVRQRVDAGLADYRIRANSVEERTIGGRPALACVADLTQGGERMVEYLVWVSGGEANALFFARAPYAELGAVRQRLEPVIASLKLP